MIPQIDCGAENWGSFHFASDESVTEVEFAEVVANILQAQGGLQGSWRAHNPDTDINLESQVAALAVRRCRDNFGIQLRGWRAGLEGVIRHALEQEKVARLL